MKVAEPTVERLVQYYRLLLKLEIEKREVISSLQIGELLGIKASQVRKDLSYFGEIGKRGVGYSVKKLCTHIENILSSPKVWKVALVGVGNLGLALLGHAAFQSYKFEVEAMFDVDSTKVGQEIMGIKCWHFDDMPRIIDEKGIEVIILAVPAEAAQMCVNQAARSRNLKGVLAFTPASVIVPENILFYTVDIFVEMEKLFFFLKEKGKKDGNSSNN